MSPARYAVLHHTGHGSDHYDFLLAVDADGPLLTWRLPDWPWDGLSRAEPLPLHRRAYLTYEGLVGGNRGRVRRVAEGVVECDINGIVAHVWLDGRVFRLPVLVS